MVPGQQKEYRDVNNLNVYRYDTREDTVFAGQPVKHVAPYTGTLHFQGTLRKPDPTTDDVTFSITVYDVVDQGNGTFIEVPRGAGSTYRRTIAWNEVGEIVLSADVHVEETDKVELRFLIDSPIDLNALTWDGTPELYYTEAYKEAAALKKVPKPQDDDTPPDEIELPTNADDYKLDEKTFEDAGSIERHAVETQRNGKYILRLPVTYDMDMYPGDNLDGELQTPWTAPKDGVVYVAPRVTLKQYLVPGTEDRYEARAPDGDIVFTAKRRGELIGKGTIQVRDRQVVANTQGLGALVAVPVRQGDEIFFGFSVRDRALAREIATASLYQTYSSNGTWRVPLTDTLTVRPRYKGGFIPEDETEQGTTEQDPAPLQQAVFVVRRGAELLVRQLLTTPAFNTDNLDFPIAVNADDELAFDLVAIGHLSLSDRSVWSNYHTDSTWVAPQGGQLTVKPQLAFGAGAPPGTVTLIVWRNGTQLTERSYLVRDGQVLGEPLAVAVQPGQTLWFDYVTGTPELASLLLDKGHVQLAYPDAAAQTVAARDFHIAMPNGHAILWIGGPSATLHYADPDPLFGNAYRGWAQAGYNGNDEWAEQPIAATRLKLSEIESDYKDFGKPVTAYLAVPMPERGRWESADPDWGLAGAYMKSTRLGRKSIDLPKPEAFAPRAGITLRVPRQSRAASHGVGGGYFISANYTRSETANQLDIIDLNGDRYPDLMGGGKVQFTLPDGSLGETLPDGNPDEQHEGLDAAARTTKNTDLAFGFGASVAIPRTDSKAKTENADSKAVHPSLVFNASVSASFGDNDGLTELLDINGDGLPDRVGWDSADNLVVRLNLGYGFADPELWGQGPAINEGTSESVALGIGGGWSTPAQTFSGGLNLSVGHNDVARQLLDMNGDGLLDYVRVVGGAIKVAFNRGGGFGGALAWDGAHQTLASLAELTADNGYGNKTTPFAVSATLSDGTSTSVTGSANFSVAIPVGVPPVFDLVFKTGGSIGQTVSQPTVGFRDVNGDGLPDSLRSPRDSTLEAALNQTGRTNLLKRIERPLGAVITLDYARRGNTYPQPHSQWVMSRVTVHDGHAGDGADVRATAYAYAGGHYDRREREFYGYATVTEQQLDTAHDDAVTRTLTRTYRTDSFYTKGLLARELTADGAGKPYLETVNTYRLRNEASGRDADPASLTARVFPALVRTERRFYEGAAEPAKTTYVTYAYDAWGNVSGFFDAGEPDTREDNVYAEIVYTGTDPAHAACGERHIVGLPTSIAVRPAPGRDPVLRERRGRYDCTTGALQQLRRRVEDPGARTGTAWAEHDFGYDRYGNLERLTGPVDANGKRHVLVFGYDAAVDTYPARIETQEAGHTQYHSIARYDYRFGVPEATIDLNGNPLTQQYDAFGRLIAVRGPYEQAAGSPPTLHFAYHPEAAVPYARTQHHDRDAEGHAKDPIETLRFVDGLKRIVQTKKDITRYVPGAAQGEAAMSISGRLRFDALGRVAEQYYPSWEKKGANTAFSGSTATESPTTTAYDVLDRPLTVTLPDESVTRHTYGFGAVDGPVQFKTETVDAEANRREVYRDVRGAISAVREFNPKGGQPALTTRYRYDRLGQIAAVTDAAGHVTAVGYDTLGRRTRLRNPDTGLLAWRYDLADNLIARVTPKLRAQGQAIAYRYDHNRLIGIDYPNGTGNAVRYVYGDDTKENRAAGRVARVSRVDHESGYEERWYGKLGETIRETKYVHLPQSAWHSGAKHTQGTTQPASYEVFTTQYDYDSFGRLLRLVYPDGEALTYRYDAGGLPESVHGTYKGAPYAYVKRLGYDHFESRVHVALGNGAVSDYGYDPKTRRLSNLTTQSLGQRFQALTYRYDRIGNVKDLVNDVAVPTDGLGGWVKQHFAYDNLARLTAASGLYQGSPDRREEYTLALAYDGIHNITHKTQRHTVTSLTGSGTKHATSYDWGYRYEGEKPHAPTHIGERTFSYDANGNQTGWRHDQNATRRAISWDDADRIQAIEDRGGEYSTYDYDDQGNRVIKQARQNLTVYVNPYFTERNGAIGSKHVFVGNTRMLTKVTGGTNFIRSYDGYTGAKVPPGQAKNVGNKTNNGKGGDKGNNGRHLGQAKDHTDQGKHLGQAKQAEKGNPGQGKGREQEKADLGKGQGQGNPGKKDVGQADVFPGQGLEHRSARANEVAQNTCQNKHLAPLYCNEEGGGDTPPADGTDSGEETPGTPPAQELIKVSMGEQLFYYHPDHLGSTSYVTRADGKLHEHIQYFPFGETWVSQGGNTEKSPYLFTAKELDEETGLYYYGARYYDPRTSVWVSADPALGKYLPSGKGQEARLPGLGGVYNPLNLGLYTYGHQNPVKLIDPDGNVVALAIPAAEWLLVGGGAAVIVSNSQAAREAIGKAMDSAVKNLKALYTLANLPVLAAQAMMNENKEEGSGSSEGSKGKKIGDIEIPVDATPDDVRNILNDAGFPPVGDAQNEPTGTGETGTVHEVDVQGTKVRVRVMDGKGNTGPRVSVNSANNPKQPVDPTTGKPFKGNLSKQKQRELSHIPLKPPSE